jgi:DNA repair exonuclease SbcCD nuclease subunit
MKDIIVGDIHLDTKSGDKNYIKYQHLFFKQLISYIKKNDVRYVIFLGDIFTNNQVININVMDYALNIFEEISKLDVQIVMINGNHVIYHKNSYDIDSVNVVFRNRDNMNIHLFGDYTRFDNYIFFNWKNTKDEYEEIFKSIPKREEIEYVFGHFDLYGFMQSKFSENNNKTSLREDDILKYFPNSHIVSGHYHIPQLQKNVTYTGVPYELSWGESDLKLGFYILEDNELTFVENKHKIYEMIYIKSLDDLTNYKIEDTEYFKYYKIVFDDRDLDEKIQEFRNVLEEKGNKVTVINNFELFAEDTELKDDDIELKESKSKTNKVEMNLDFIFKDYIYKLNIDDDLKDDVYNRFIKIYGETKAELTQNFEL